MTAIRHSVVGPGPAAKARATCKHTGGWGDPGCWCGLLSFTLFPGDAYGSRDQWCANAQVEELALSVYTTMVSCWAQAAIMSLHSCGGLSSLRFLGSGGGWEKGGLVGLRWLVSANTNTYRVKVKVSDSLHHYLSQPPGFSVHGILQARILASQLVKSAGSSTGH